MHSSVLKTRELLPNGSNTSIVSPGRMQGTGHRGSRPGDEPAKQQESRQRCTEHSPSWQEIITKGWSRFFQGNLSCFQDKAGPRTSVVTIQDHPFVIRPIL